MPHTIIVQGRMSQHEAAALRIMTRAVADAIDFGTELRAGYVQSCCETYFQDNGPMSEWDMNRIVLELNRLGFFW